MEGRGAGGVVGIVLGTSNLVRGVHIYDTGFLSHNLGGFFYSGSQEIWSRLRVRVDVGLLHYVSYGRV